MSGSGNDFIIIDHRTEFLHGIELSEFARSICRRNFSVGADGLILIENSQKADFSWQFFNADGSSAEMCGNGARCAARFAYAKQIAPASMKFETMAGIIAAEVVDTAIRLGMTPPEEINHKREIDLDGEIKTVYSINTGVPHAVMFADQLSAVPVKKWGALIRFHEFYKPAGTNANFVETLDSGTLRVRTYERGVEDETLACGTGAVAAAIIGAIHGYVKPPVNVLTPGGETLVIHFSLENPGEPDIKDVQLEGPARFIYEGLLDAEAIG